jgi:hypothetical protein
MPTNVQVKCPSCQTKLEFEFPPVPKVNVSCTTCGHSFICTNRTKQPPTNSLPHASQPQSSIQPAAPHALNPLQSERSSNSPQSTPHRPSPSWIGSATSNTSRSASYATTDSYNAAMTPIPANLPPLIPSKNRPSNLNGVIWLVGGTFTAVGMLAIGAIVYLISSTHLSGRSNTSIASDFETAIESNSNSRLLLARREEPFQRWRRIHQQTHTRNC